MCNLARGGQMAISAVSFFLPMQFLCIKVRALGLHGTSAFTSWAIFLASTSSFMKGLKPLSFLRRCHLLSVLFVSPNKTELMWKWGPPFLGKGDGESEGGPETQGGQQCRKAWPLSSELLLTEGWALSLFPGRQVKGDVHLSRQKMDWSVDGTEKEDRVPNSTLAKGTVIKTDIADVSEGFEQRNIYQRRPLLGSREHKSKEWSSPFLARAHQ